MSATEDAIGLRVDGLTLKRGGLVICREISLDVAPGEITVLLGANGAGKSTLLAGIAGVIPASAGEIRLGGQRIDGIPMHRRAMRGLAYIEQGRSVFSRLTVAQNIGVVDRSPAALERAFELFPRLADRRHLPAGLLSGGEQQMLIIARALATAPRILLVDEPSLGLAPRLVDVVMEALAELARAGLGILLVEQFAAPALAIGSTAHVVRRGRIVRTAPCAGLRADDALLMTGGVGRPGHVEDPAIGSVEEIDPEA